MDFGLSIIPKIIICFYIFVLPAGNPLIVSLPAVLYTFGMFFYDREIGLEIEVDNISEHHYMVYII